MNETWERFPSAQLLGWSAWAPGLTDRAAWERWARAPAGGGGLTGSMGEGAAKAPCRDLPPLLRRRCSGLTRMVVETSFEVCRAAGVEPSGVATVFCSRHGEIGVLREILDGLYERAPVSPTLFSNSVHHTPTGYFDLACGNRQPSKTLSAGGANLVCGYLESLGTLGAGEAGERVCLLAVADEPVPEPFGEGLRWPPFPYALALVLATPAARIKGRELELARMQGGEAGKKDDGDLDFLRWLVQDDGPFDMTTPFGTWRWTSTTGRRS